MNTSRSLRLGSTLRLAPALAAATIAACSPSGDRDAVQETDGKVASRADHLATRGVRLPSKAAPAPLPPDAGIPPLTACGVCAKANECCNAVGGGQLCTFSMATCESLRPQSRVGYVSGCRTLLTTAFRARTKSGGTAPASCR